ncbi:rhombosortase [Aliivibrio kagoshimensis]|uniref:rhombosortase n=1 Tax=Aliivibrio kagoshimensis TaxID=2910230 RepID=UPI003D106276
MLRLLLLLLALMVAFQIPTVSEMVLWDRALIHHGELWRIVTGNFTHTNFAHLLMNSGALIIFYLLFKEYLNNQILLPLLLSTSLVVGLSIFLTDIDLYFGLSGVIHGLLAWGAVKDIQYGRQSGYWLLGGIIAKVIWEQLFGASSSTMVLIDARVAIEAHLAGLIYGIVFALLMWSYKRIRG